MSGSAAVQPCWTLQTRNNWNRSVHEAKLTIALS